MGDRPIPCLSMSPAPFTCLYRVTGDRLPNLTVSAIQYYKLVVCSEAPSVPRAAFHCVLNVNMREVNAGVPVMLPRVHFA